MDTIMNANKELSTSTILNATLQHQKACRKLQMDNIIFPKWSDLGLVGAMFRQRVCTKEQPGGCDYPEGQFQVVMRVIGGKLLMTGGRPDAYAWKFSKVEQFPCRPIGTNSAKGVINLAQMLALISDEKEKLLFADMFCNWNKDLLLVTSDEEDRTCIEITQEIYDMGITYCVDEWMEVDDMGCAPVTKLNVGDFLIITKNGVYCIRHDEFIETHTLNA